MNIGTPIIFNCEYKWTFRKLRHTIWQSISRYLYTEPTDIENMDNSNNTKNTSSKNTFLLNMAKLIKEAETTNKFTTQFFWWR